ncbi:ribokinase [Streptomyces spiroverticillatus]|uniref:Ribokinase n=1 Tax=Streptomyces finlayi TaxID=67296 RepID=A0A918WXJ4_9ACTN|nr:ribokinase [Streptomyces finlayi]GGZ92843.1 ribokinase [Streptomyces spiroverticillatus]GHC92764.1 ribokinase [Streptomyces finlayi]
MTPPPPTLTVLGSTNMDLVVYVAKAPAGGETVSGRSFTTVPGGKGANQAIAAARAGADVTMIGAVGTDSFGEQLRAALAHSGVDTDSLRTAEGPSGTAHIVVDDDGGNSIVVIPGANGTVTGLSPGDETVISQAHALLLQLELPLSVVTEGAQTARRHGVRTILTPAPATTIPPELFAATDLLVPNEHEAAALTGLHDPLLAARTLLDHVPAVVVTLGAAGCAYVTRNTPDPLFVPAVPATPVDTTAAGDTFVGALAVALAEGRPMHEALPWASAAASLSVQRPGASTSMPYRQEIDAL